MELTEKEKDLLKEAVTTAMAAIWRMKEEAYELGANNVGKMLFERYCAFSDLQMKLNK